MSLKFTYVKIAVCYASSRDWIIFSFHLAVSGICKFLVDVVVRDLGIRLIVIGDISAALELHPSTFRQLLLSFRSKTRREPQTK